MNLWVPEGLRSFFFVGVRSCARALCLLLLLSAFGIVFSQSDPSPVPHKQSEDLRAAPAQPLAPARVRQAQRFLAARGIRPGRRLPQPPLGGAAVHPDSAGTNAWQPIGPAAVASENYGLVTGRVSALALDPSDTTGNKLYVGATGGGVWFSQNANAASGSGVEFVPLTDGLSALSGVIPASISVGALTVQPGATGVILAGTGDPNDALDSYYGAGILRSADSGKTWSLIPATVAAAPGSANQVYGFAGEGFAGFAWSTVNPNLVVAAVSQALESALVNAEAPNLSYEGLYYSTDAGATWNLATITDGPGRVVQGPLNAFALPDGNAATSVVWNPVRKLFVAAVRFHGYYQSSDGITWTRMAAQPGANLTTTLCPANPGSVGSTDCPIFRGTLAVNPQNGDTFAWTVDENNQDQGLWQDKCSINRGACSTQAIAFSQRLNTSPLESNTLQGPATIANGDYNLALAAVPFQQDTYVLAGANDLWKCSLAAGCVWRNTTNAGTCASAMVGGYQHAIAWNPANPLEIFVGNDSGAWRSTDAIGESGEVCNPADATHFQNLNGSLGSLAEVESLSIAGTTQYTMMAGLGANGTAGVKSSSRVTDWPETEDGEGGPVAIDPENSSAWYVNNQAGVAIHLCSQPGSCSPTAFRINPVVNDADTGNDGLTMTTPAPFLVDPADHTQLLIGTCRVWRGPANGVGWTASNAISPILDGNLNNASCQGDALIRSIAALSTTGGNETVYAGMYGSLDGGSTLAGHIFSATFKPGGTVPKWHDLTLNPVTNDTHGMNAFGLDISSIFIDPHDPTGNTVYVTVEGFFSIEEGVQQVYRSTDGGAHWQDLTSNLDPFPANSVVVDPQDANTVYLATDAGVFSTRAISTCAIAQSACWTAFGAGLPQSPVVQLAASPITSTAHVLTAATYGRGIWQNPLWTANELLTTAAVKPTSLTFAKQKYGSTSTPQTVTLSNTGAAALTASIAMSGDFSETDNCQAGSIAKGASCTIQVTFTPTAIGMRTGQMTISANVAGGQITVALGGTGIAAGAVTLNPASLKFGQVTVGETSAALAVTADNAGRSPVSVSGVRATGPFSIKSNTCGSTIPAQTSCQLLLQFTPAKSGAATGTLTMTDSVGTQSVSLSGDGAARATDTLSTASLALPATVTGQISSAETVTLTNSGDLSLTSISVSIDGPFQQSNNCGAMLPGRSSCAFSVKFAPASTGTQTGTLTISDAIRVQTVKLSGVGELPGKITVQPASIAFPAQSAGVPSAPRTLTVSNTGGAPITQVSFSITGSAAASFAVSATTCEAVLNKGASCTAQVKFTPAETGGNQATLAVSSSTVGVAEATVALSGVGLPPPELEVSPTSLNFETELVGKRTAAESMTVANVGGAALNDMRLFASGDFAFSAGNCGTRLAVGAKCIASIRFAPAATGVRAGVFTISSASGAALPATIILEGFGIGPATILTSAGELDFGSVPAGQTSPAKTLTITDQGTTALSGLNLTATGAFALKQEKCGRYLPANKNCSVQVVFTPSAVGAQTGTLTVSSSTKWASPAIVVLAGIGSAEPALAAAPAQLAFGSIETGKTSRALSIGITNPGTGTVTGLTLTASGDFAIAHNGCGTTLAANGACSAQIVFSPRAAGSLTGALTASGTQAGLKAASIRLSGIGEPAGALFFDNSNLVFGNTAVGHHSVPQLATLTNTSKAPASGLTYKATGDFAIEDNECGATLAAGASCTMDIVFTPSASTSRIGTLNATSNTAGIPAAEEVLTGVGVAPAYLSASPARLSFPATPVGSSSTPMIVNLSNPGIAAAAGLKVVATGDFTAILCGTTLQPGKSCAINVVFTPSGQGVRAGRLTLTTTAAGAAPVVIPLEGTGSAPPAISLSPGALNFAAIAPGQTSPPQTIVVSNTGSAPMDQPKLAIDGDFSISSNACTASLPAGGKCKTQIEFTPTAIGGRAGALTVTSATKSVQPALANLIGTGLTPSVIGVSPASLTFPTVKTGLSSTPQTVTVQNDGGGPIDSLKLAISPQFALTANTCKSSLALGAKCTVGIYFKPAAQGPVTGALTIAAPTATISADVALSGTGGSPAAIAISPGVLNFPTVGVGRASSPLTVTVTNLGNAEPLRDLGLKAPDGFQFAKNNCKATLEPRSSCTVDVEFVPTVPGLREANLVVTAAGLSPTSLALSGTGFDFTVAFKGGVSQTVASGQAASYGFSIAPLAGSAGDFTFSCGKLPANAQCVFNPASEAVNAYGTGFVTVQVATGQGAAAGTTATPVAGRVIPAALGVFLLPLALRKRRKTLLLAVLLATLAGGVTGCLSASGGIGKQNPSAPGSTPPATYSIPVIVTANGVQHAVTVTLTVD